MSFDQFFAIVTILSSKTFKNPIFIQDVHQRKLHYQSVLRTSRHIYMHVYIHIHVSIYRCLAKALPELQPVINTQQRDIAKNGCAYFRLSQVLTRRRFGAFNTRSRRCHVVIMTDWLNWLSGWCTSISREPRPALATSKRCVFGRSTLCSLKNGFRDGGSLHCMVYSSTGANAIWDGSLWSGSKWFSLILGGYHELYWFSGDSFTMIQIHNEQVCIDYME